jgi:phosphoribosylpyrophosphate synthetase
MLSGDEFVVYGGTVHHAFDQSVLELVNDITGLHLVFSHIWHDTWPDGEHGFHLSNHTGIKGRHAIIFGCPITNDLELELRDIITACKRQYGARTVTVILSFMRYRRQDRDEKFNEITRLRWFMSDLRHWGVDQLVVCEPHSVHYTKRYCEEFGLDLYICDPTNMFAEAIIPIIQTLGREKVSIYSPDFGSVGRALALAKATGTSVIATPKKRLWGDTVFVSSSSESEEFLRRISEMYKYGTEVSVSCDMENVRGRYIFIREDEMSTGSTAVSTAKMLRTVGASGVWFIATHAVCSYGWKAKFFPWDGEQPFDGVFFGNTRPRGIGGTTYRESTGGRIHTVDIAPALAKTLISVLERVYPGD